MIDNIVMIKNNLSETEIKSIVTKSRLLEQSVNGLKVYHNGKNKNLEGGFYIKISENKTLKITGSLHKYYTYLSQKKLNNFDSFTMQQAKETMNKLVIDKGFNIENTKVTFYEIGLNLVVDFEPSEILKNVKSIGTIENEKEFFYNPQYKKKTHKNTLTHRDFRIYHKMYDKVFEMQDKRKQPPSELKIIRIETAHRRVENTLLTNFLKDENLNLLQKKFFSYWHKLNFFNDVDAPKGTHKSKIELAKEIMHKGKVEVLNTYVNQYKNLVLSAKMYYSIKKFIDNWELDKHSFKVKKTDIFTYWQKVYNTEYQLYNSNKSNELICIDKNFVSNGTI